MPRAEAQAIGEAVALRARAILPGVEVVVCGSYRRGKANSGDVDVLIGPPPGAADFADVDHLINPTWPGLPPHRIGASRFMGALLVSLRVSKNECKERDRGSRGSNKGDVGVSAHSRCRGLLTDDLSSIPRYIARGHSASYMGVARLSMQSLGEVTEPGLHRRIDIKTYPRAAVPFALFYFTGSGHFNRR